MLDFAALLPECRVYVVSFVAPFLVHNFYQLSQQSGALTTFAVYIFIKGENLNRAFLVLKQRQPHLSLRRLSTPRLHHLRTVTTSTTLTSSSSPSFFSSSSPVFPVPSLVSGAYVNGQTGSYSDTHAFGVVVEPVLFIIDKQLLLISTTTFITSHPTKTCRQMTPMLQLITIHTNGISISVPKGTQFLPLVQPFICPLPYS
ncbi:hypothetical protein K435DRAFT_857716 [Dendrothele bispora CBS 962.96]|uniref:Uncharacterized protein n=1 Tax=Dendrothele bispora (strain CBS 962.96) TaxID=1314807 RepID=A0A4V4HG33_DENBC|nr:hypothetical protein K435DRAFT_857716 [Dendrothele bispora CBS 962.96]